MIRGQPDDERVSRTNKLLHDTNWGGGGEVHLTTCIIVIIMSCMLYHVHDKIDAGYNTAM